MEMGLGIQIIFPLAAQEASSGGAAEIEPGHIICALLKLAEMPSSVLQKVIPKKELTDLIEKDKRELCSIFESFGLKVPTGSTKLRRELRKVLGKNRGGRAGKADKVIHRSAETKALFAKAEEEARKAGEDKIGTGRLAQTLFSSQDKALAEALANIGNMQIDTRLSPKEARMAWIDAYGCDLTAQARSEKPDIEHIESIRRDPVCKVLAESLFTASGNKFQPVLLVSRGKREADDVVNNLAIWLVSSSPPANKSDGCIIELYSASILSHESGDSLESRLENIFQETSKFKSTALFFDNFHRYLTTTPTGENQSHHFKTLLTKLQIPCVMGMTQKQYETYIENNINWSKIFRLIWIHDERPNFML